MKRPLSLVYTSPKELRPWLQKAAAVWNDVLKGSVVLRDSSEKVANIKVYFSTGVQTAINPTRVAQCRRVTQDHWAIELDGSGRTKWGLTKWQRFWGIGEDVLAALVHELGHVFGIPHYEDEEDRAMVMHPEIGGDGKLPQWEKDLYKEYFDNSQIDP